VPASTHVRSQTGRTLAVLAGLIALLAIGFLASNVAREMQLLRSAQSDNAQWSLAQTEVEFLDFANATATFQEPPARIRRRFDIFYSRIQTIENAQVYASLRKSAHFMDHLADTRSFLNEAVQIIDLPDAQLIDRKDDLHASVQNARSTIRGLSNAGLSIFAVNADQQRAAVAMTVAQLAIALIIFIAALGTSIVYLNRLNAQNIMRERAQKEIATRMNTVIETSLDGVIVSDDQGIVIEFSRAAEAIFGYTAAEALGQSVGDLIIPEHHRTSHQDGMARLHNGGAHHVVGAGRMQMEAMRKAGQHFPVELSIQVADYHNRKIYIAFLRDISNAVAVEQDLVTARDAALAGEKLKTDFLTTMSHEIRTPLNGLLGNLSLMKDTKLSAQQNRYMHNMETSGRLLMGHISDVLDITRYDVGKLPINIGPMNISILLQDIIDNQSAMAETAGTTLTWGWIGAPRDWVLSDPDRVQIIIINLISNAVKFTRGGSVAVTADVIKTHPHKDHIRFCITDTGPGIPPDFTKHIFDDFVTGNAAYDRDVGGTGLGLGITKRFVTALGGYINVESTLGKGSTFEVILPMPAADGTTDGSDVSNTPQTKPLSILLIDDNDINRIVAREMLETAGHTVSEAPNGKVGVQVANHTQFDLILMDISMPVMDGRTATRHIKTGHGKSADAPIVALTAHAMPEDQLNFAADGMVATLTKPLTKHSLLGVLNMAHMDSAARDDISPLYRSKSYAKLWDRFIAETDSFVDWSQTPDLTLPAIADQAHKTAGSAATFQVVAFSERLKSIAVSCRAGDQSAVTDQLAALPSAWNKTKATIADQTIQS
jgi:PAS domain S-box-containing protein